ncbi:uncharacterized protein LOC109853819 [Pseudomyrmex gracilis]|uniref:uncharacterized protein LOC109853819 n=1 Tax=Pseudomyrmex gracilis TaxID=219809 RepID=UPI000995C270|nr:uncharacterized protein LOC109853819 [Pseudomyrmex gracilis]
MKQLTVCLIVLTVAFAIISETRGQQGFPAYQGLSPSNPARSNDLYDLEYPLEYFLNFPARFLHIFNDKMIRPFARLATPPGVPAISPGALPSALSTIPAAPATIPAAPATIPAAPATGIPAQSASSQG